MKRGGSHVPDEPPLHTGLSNYICRCGNGILLIVFVKSSRVCAANEISSLVRCVVYINVLINIHVLQLQPVRHNLQRPRKMRYNKHFKNIYAVAKNDNKPLVVPTPWYLRYGIYASERGYRLTDRHIETMRLYLTRKVARNDGFYRIRIFPHIPVTKKPVGVRMGGGKGSVHHFVAFVKKGTMICEFDIDNSPWDVCKGLDYLLPIPIKWVDRKDLGLPMLPRPQKKQYQPEETEEEEEVEKTGKLVKKKVK